ncbi:prophage maintenance system killer protein [Pedobacter africanus]|uniref:Prophage maintenance system killer protein n=1 Tax=Pedobacter africanus TaxID=151894 RepID=A0ACC6KXB0_9SPHI|nr:virulence protein RhuM/Fic/DOC family protein [Pedobacter africanus]MDR6783897.1 prophage maintenance system killer protein [Pedobacter africanus]
MMQTEQIIIYQAEDGTATIDVKLKNETIWLTQYDLAELFETDRTSLTKHIKNIYKTEELDEASTCAKIAQVQTEGTRTIKRDINHYNLDLIISVGYRVNSKRGTQFRIWANKILKDYLVKGYSINEKRLKEQEKQLKDLKKTVTLLSNVLENKELNSDEATGLLRVVTDYAYALDVLDKYDHQELTIEGTTSQELFRIDYPEAINAIYTLRNKYGGSSLFGNEKDQSFKGSLAAIYQTFAGIDLYPSVEEKAGNLLYFVVKNHSFSDGNKRIAAYLFVWFLEQNGCLYKPDGSKRIADNALVALTLMIAESKSDDKDIMVKVIVNLINTNN